MDQDRQHLQLLSIFHYVLGGLVTLFGFFPLIYVAMGVFIIAAPIPQRPNEPPMAAFGWIFVVVGMLISLLFWTLAACLIASGRSLSQQRRYTFCLVIACIACLQVPLGTILGVFTLVVLLRPSVKELFDGRTIPDAMSGPSDYRYRAG